MFSTTHWSVVIAAARGRDDGASSAFETLCRTYWLPLYAFVRRLGNSPNDAQDLTQAFFQHVIESGLVGKADMKIGRFRSFLLGSLKRFLSHERDRAAAQRRGGGTKPVPFDTAAAESALGADLQKHSSPDALYDRKWALAVLEQALHRMRSEFERSGRSKLFECLCPAMQGEKHGAGYAEIARKLGTTDGTIKVTVHRMRQRYRELLAEVVAQTVSHPGDIDAELEELMAALRG